LNFLLPARAIDGSKISIDCSSLHLVCIVRAGMKAIPRFREAIAFLKLRHQPASIKWPLVSLQIASNPNIYSAEQLKVKEEVSHANTILLI